MNCLYLQIMKKKSFFKYFIKKNKAEDVIQDMHNLEFCTVVSLFVKHWTMMDEIKMDNKEHKKRDC